MSLAFRSRAGASALRAAARSLSASTASSSSSSTAPAIVSSHRPIAAAASSSWSISSRPFSASTLYRAAAGASADDHHEVEHTIDNPPPRHTVGHPPESRYNSAGVIPTHDEILARLTSTERQKLQKMDIEASRLVQKLQGLEITEDEAIKRLNDLMRADPDLKNKCEEIYNKLLVEKNPQLAHHDEHHDDHHHEEFNPNRGWLWGVKPGEKAEREGWEMPAAFGGVAIFFCVVAMIFRPDTRLDTWALEEARRRLEKEGILPDPYPEKAQ